MKIAVLYICTGRYTIFWDNFFKSCEHYFLSNHEKHYFVFTDGDISYAKNPRVHRIQQENLGWPDNTLRRFHMFSKIRETLHPFDYIYFFNGTCLFCTPVGEECLPNKEEGLALTQHPHFWNKPQSSFIYDRNPQSLAYIPEGEGKHYVAGGVNGGTTDSFLKLVDDLCRAIDTDAAKNIVALWHDESHLNRYAIDHPYKLLDTSYCYPENWNFPFLPKIRILDKKYHGGHIYLRDQSNVPTPEDPPLVVVSLMGGLGNQMFQYAAARALCWKLNSKLLLELGWLTRQKEATPREFQLDLFPRLPVQIANAMDCRIAKYGRNLRQGPLWKRLGRLALCVRDKFLRNPPRRIFREPHTEFWDGLNQIIAPAYLEGYWQSEKYFAEIADKIRQDFTFPEWPTRQASDMAKSIAAAPHSVAVHIRRGDYVTDPEAHATMGICSPAYYNAALKYVAMQTEHPHLFLFSDDHAWVRDNFDTQGLTATIVDLHSEQDGIHDMHLMSLCKHHIIANSSFSWWGAWLAQPGGITCAPDRWFAAADKRHYTPVLEQWQRVTLEGKICMRVGLQSQ